MPRIKIYTHGSSSLGLGHIRRSLFLAKELSQRLITTVCIVEGIKYIDQKKINNSMINICSGKQKPRSDELILIDMDQSVGIDLRHQLIKERPFIAMDWFDETVLPIMCWNLYDHSMKMKKAYQAKKRDRAYFEGPQYAIIRDEIKSLRPNVLKSEKSEKLNVTITIGGADPKGRSINAAKDLLTMKDKINKMTFILGSLTSTDTEKRLFSILSNTYHQILREPADYANHLKNADLIICNGGTTLLESMHIGKPIVVYPQSIAEQNHGQYHTLNKACVFSDQLQDVIHSEDLRRQLAYTAWNTVDGQGSRRICSSIAGIATQ